MVEGSQPPRDRPPGRPRSQAPDRQERAGHRRHGLPRAGRLRAAADRLPRDPHHAARPAAARLERPPAGRVAHRPADLRRAARPDRQRGDARRCSTSASRSSTATSRRTSSRSPAISTSSIHCAATVAFDPPIDEGFRTNLLGAVRFYEAVLATNDAPHLVHVSTAYVAGNRKGVIPEATLDHRVELARGGRARPPRAGRRRGREPQARAARLVPAQGAGRARPRRPAVGRRRRRGAPQELGDEAARAVRARASADARLAGQLHVHEGDGRARCRGARGRARRTAFDRAALDHRVHLRAPVPGLDRGLQDGRADHPGLRARHDPRVPRHPRGHRRHHPGRLRRERDARGRGEPARARSGPPTTT